MAEVSVLKNQFLHAHGLLLLVFFFINNVSFDILLLANKVCKSGISLLFWFVWLHFFYFGGWDGGCCAVLEDKYGICYNSTLSERPETVTD